MYKVDLDSKAIKNLAFELKKEQENLLLVLGASNGDKATITVVVSWKRTKRTNKFQNIESTSVIS